MTRKSVLTIAVGSAMLFSACGSAATDTTQGNSNANMANGTVVNQNLPEGFSTKPIEPSANGTPGIPANPQMQTVPANVSPAEGIPSAEDLKKPRKPGATPTPGIPAPEELKKQMNTPRGNTNTQ
ncbi:MAG: hypothetical protein QUS14_17945 [Pyrinomonadaceae bacterium]|nr:hypothetical protein [Pyrinomonadaceae bacterium]